MQATQDKTEDERRRQWHKHAAWNRKYNSAYLCLTCGRTCLSLIGLYSHERSHLQRSDDKSDSSFRRPPKRETLVMH